MVAYTLRNTPLRACFYMGYIQEAVMITVLKLWLREDFINFFDLEIYRFINFYFYLLIMVDRAPGKEDEETGRAIA